MPIKKVCIYQPGRFGDILYVIPLVRRLIEKGYDVEFPIYKMRYNGLNVKDHFPDINFTLLDPKHPKIPIQTGLIDILKESHIILPLWYGSLIEDTKDYHPDRLMTNKYVMYNKAFDDDLNPNTYWHNLTWKRFPKRERELMEFLGIKPNEKYVLINEKYGWGKKLFIDIKTDLKKVYLRPIEGFSILDWSLILENAEEIHTVDTATLYIIEVLKTTEKLHRYRRESEDVELKHLFRKKYIKHLSNGSVENEI